MSLDGVAVPRPSDRWRGSWADEVNRIEVGPPKPGVKLVPLTPEEYAEHALALPEVVERRALTEAVLAELEAAHDAKTPPSPQPPAREPSPEVEAQREAAKQVVREAQARAKDNPNDGSASTTKSVADILRTRLSGPCKYGKRRHISNRDAGVVKHGYKLCRGAKCPRCCPGYIDSIIDRALRAWDGKPVHVSVFLADEWRNGARARSLKHEYPRAYLRVRVDGGHVVFTPGEILDSRPVGPEVGKLVAETILLAPATCEGGEHRVTVPRVPKEAKTEAEVERELEAGLWVSEPLPTALAVESFNAMAGDAIKKARATRGLPEGEVDWLTEIHVAGHFKRFTLSGLADWEVDAVRTKLRPYFEMAREEEAERRAASAATRTRLVLTAGVV